MGFFYFDESIQEKGGFIVGAFAFSQTDLTPAVFRALAEAGLRPGIEEFKSGALIVAHPKQTGVREALRGLLSRIRIGTIVLPTSERKNLGTEAIAGLTKIIHANSLVKGPHRVYIDEGIVVEHASLTTLRESVATPCEVLVNQDSRIIGGIQLADLAAHSMGIMLLEHQGHITKMVKAGENSGYDPGLDIELGFELWASLRYAFFKAPKPIPGAEDSLGDAMFDVENYGLYVSETCNEELRKAAIERFGKCYLGCIH